MDRKEALESIMGAIPNIEDFSEALEILNGGDDTADEGNSMWESKYKSLKDAYMKKWGDYTNPDTVRSVAKEAMESGVYSNISSEDKPQRAERLEDLSMSFDGSTE